VAGGQPRRLQRDADPVRRPHKRRRRSRDEIDERVSGAARKDGARADLRAAGHGGPGRRERYPRNQNRESRPQFEPPLAPPRSAGACPTPSRGMQQAQDRFVIEDTS